MKNKNELKAGHIARHIATIMKEGREMKTDADNPDHPQTPEEAENVEAFDEWVRENSFAVEVLSRLSDEEQFEVDFKDYSFPEFERTKRVESLMQSIARYERRRVRYKMIRWMTGVAAGVAVIVACMLLLSKPTFQDVPVVPLATGGGVKLILEDQSVVELGNSTDSVALADMIIYTRGGNTSSSSVIVNLENQIVTFSTLSVPEKMTYTMELSDGTIVTLNAGSRMRFPSRFTGDSREVTIWGEGYFAVAKDSEHPFIVYGGDVAVRVYGTRFNVNTYNTDISEVLLLEGQVGISIKGKDEILLAPSQLATVDLMKGSISVASVEDTEHYLAWLDNYFDFSAAPLDKVVSEISRWYGVVLEIQEGSDVLVTASYSRETGIDEIIVSLERIAGTKIIKKLQNRNE